jgi:hypothetical protein
MAYENIRFSKTNMTVDDNSFYMMDDTRDVLFRKTDGGKTAFTYPLGTVLSYAVTSLEFDGINFWSMENVSTSAVAIKRWKIDSNGICALMNTFNFTSVATPRTFTVEHYHDTLSSGVVAGENVIHIDNYASTLVSGSVLTLGPTTSGSYYEEVAVTSVSGQDITLSSGVSYNYALGDSVNFYNNIWMFNSTGAGTLHKINALTGSGIVTYSGSTYDDVSACTFYKVEGPLGSPKDYLVYHKKDTKLIHYLDVNTMGDENMSIDNDYDASYYPIYDMAIVGNNLYRLQLGQNYYGTNYNWTTYNYVLSTTRRFIDTINVSAYPIILPNNATNVSKITALVNDQYGDGVWNKPVYFTDDDPVGFMTINPAYTDYFFGTGEAVSYYKAGTAVRPVIVEGTATQLD